MAPKVVSPSQKSCPELRPASEEPVASEARVRSPELRWWLKKAHGLAQIWALPFSAVWLYPKTFTSLNLTCKIGRKKAVP